MTKHKKSQTEATIREQGAGLTTRKIKWYWLIAMVIMIIVTVSLLSGFWKSTSSSNMGTTGHTFTARKGDLVITVTEAGSIQARQTIDIRSEVYGDATIIKIVPEGAYITQEDVDNNKILVQMDASEMEDRLQEEEKGLASAEASFTEEEENYRIRQNQNESDITAAKLAVQFGLLDLQNYIGKNATKILLEDVAVDPNETIEVATLADFLSEPNNLGGEALQTQKQYENDILLAQGQLDKATDVFEGTQKLYDANYASALDLKSADLDVQRYRVQKETAEETLRLYLTYTLPKQALNLLSIYREAGNELRRTEARARSYIAQAQARLSNAEEDLADATTDVERIRKQVEACTIRAPAPGMVVYATSGRSWRSEERGPIQEGTKVYQRQKIITLPNTSEMLVEVSVHESSVDKVRPGQNVTIIAEPFPDMTYHGKVLSVAPLPDQESRYFSPDTKVYKTKVSIEETDTSLRPGMSAKVEILVEELDDILMVPVQVVANRNGRKVCYVATENGPEEREVETGSFNDTFVEIVAGLVPGENILLNPPKILEPQTIPQPEESVTAMAGQ
jgi:HlyD family secretion protein